MPEIHTISDLIRLVGGFTYATGEWADLDNYVATVNDEVRLTIGIAGYDEAEPNGVNNVNNWLPSATTFYEIEAETAFELDNGGLGNGDVNAIMNMLSSPNFKRFRLDIIIREDGI